MSIPFYFAMEENEADPPTEKRCAQLGFGFREDGTLRLPSNIIPGAPAVINDLYLPLRAPDSAVLDRLAEACGNGCFLDFERPIGEVSAAIALGLQQRLKAKMTVPPSLHRLCPDADVQIAGPLCNHWERFVLNVQARYGNHWALEIIPWNVSVQTSMTCAQKGYLQNAECCYQIEGKRIAYYDSEESIKKKIAAAEKHGCQSAIALYREYRNID